MGQEAVYDTMQHGVPGFRVAVYSERMYGMIPHYMDEYYIFFLKYGKLLFGIEDEEFYVTDGDVLFIPPGTSHYMCFDENTSRPHEFHCYSIAFDISMIGDETDYVRRFFETIEVNRHLKMRDVDWARLSDMRRWDIKKEFGWEINLKNALMDMLTHIVNSGQFTQIHNDGKEERIASEVIKDVVAYLNEHYKERINVDEIAKRFRYSSSHLHKLFKQYTDTSIIQYVNKLRLKNASDELSYTNKKVTEIALDNGFDDPKYFSKLFTDKIGMPPLKYRKLTDTFAHFMPEDEEY